MTFIRKRGFGLIWLVTLVVIIGASVLGFFVIRSNAGNNNTPKDQKADVERADASTSVKTEAVATGRTITTGDSEFGSILFDADRRAVYIWEPEDSSTAECYGDCAKVWPPVITDGAPIASGSVKSELLGTTKRTDGTTQVTYNGHPLYYYAHEKAGEVTCHNIRTHGGLWWVVKPNGVRA